MTKKHKGSKSESSKSRKRPNTNSSASSTTIDDKLTSQPITPGIDGGPISSEDQTVITENQDDVFNSKDQQEDVRFVDDSTLTQVIIEKYEGNKQDGRFHGDGRIQFVNQNIYEGSMNEGTMHGYGCYQWPNLTYKGEFRYNEISGEGEYEWDDGCLYKGQLENGIRHGYGIFMHPSGKLYEGEWENGKRNGKGIQKYDHEGVSYYHGYWKNDVIEGYGSRQYGSGNIYTGDWYRGKRHGKGTMKWLDRNEEYSGQWKNGIQHGEGCHIWNVKRIRSTQYCMVNKYVGTFSEGKRHGYGVFYYASGARYEGYWENNKKNGKGIFIFKNQNMISGDFEDDRLKEEFDKSCVDLTEQTDQEDVDQLHLMMQKDIETMSTGRLSQCSLNTVSPSFQLKIDRILQDDRLSDPEQEYDQIRKSVLLHLPTLRKIYQFYSSIGKGADSRRASDAMSQLQLWRFLKDCQFHVNLGVTLADFNRFINTDEKLEDIHDYKKSYILMEFINLLIVIAYSIYTPFYIENYSQYSGYLLSKCFDEMLRNQIIPRACIVGGRLFEDIQKSEVFMELLPQFYYVYKLWCCYKHTEPSKDEEVELTMKMRDCLVLMKKLEILDSNLSAKDVVEIFSYDNPHVTDGQFVCLDIEITFYEFLELMLEYSCKDIPETQLIHESGISEEINQDLEGSTEQKIIESKPSDDGDGASFSRPTTGGGEGGGQTSHTIGTGKSSNKPAISEKTKVSSADSSNTKVTRKEAADKSASSKKIQKSGKSQKSNVATKTRRMSIEREASGVKSEITPKLPDDEKSNQKSEIDDQKERMTKSAIKIELTPIQKFERWLYQLQMIIEKITALTNKYVRMEIEYELKLQQKEEQEHQLEERNDEETNSDAAAADDDDDRLLETPGFNENELVVTPELLLNNDDGHNSLSIIQEVTIDYDESQENKK